MENNNEETFPLQKCTKSLLFVIFDINALEVIQKIQEIKNYKDEANKDNDKEKHFDLILIVKKNDKYIKDKINRYKLGVYFLCEKPDSNFNKFFGNYEELDSKCIFINKNMEISLIIENDIEFLSKDTIEYYLERDSEINKYGLFDCYKKDNINQLQKKCENNKFKEYLEKLKEKYNLKIEFREIGDKKYPVNVQFEYHQDDEETANIIIKQLIDYIEKLKIKKHFIVKKIKKSDNQKNNDQNKVINELMESNRNIIQLKKELKKEKEEKEFYKNELNKEKSKINLKIITDDENVIYSNKWNKTDKIALIKEDLLNKYPRYKNYIFVYKGKKVEDSEDLNHYNIQDNDEIYCKYI